MAERARYRLILTGTPLSQGVVDLFAQMRFLSPKILGYRSWYSFAANHLEYSDKYKGMIVRSLNTQYLAERIRPYVYQVTKEECLNLPAKLFDFRYCGLTQEQSEAYSQAKEEIFEDIENDEDFSSYHIFRLFTTLQSIVCGFWNRPKRRRCEMVRGEKQEYEHLVFPERRTGMLMDTIRQIPNGEKVIIWGKFRHSIEAIVKELSETYGPESVSQFHGGLTERARNEQIERFRRSARFFVATQAAGGHGLTLNEASHVIFYANGFKYSERLQAEDRCHRIGQTEKVLYMDIISDSGIDGRIMKALTKKGNALRDFREEVEKVKKKGIKNSIRKMVMDL
jgi:SNF2 family DNA or RNA helicase